MMQPEKEFEVFWEKERLEWPTSMAENPMLKDAIYAGWKAGKSQQTPIDVTPEVSDRDFADLVNSLRDTATKYAGTQQLRAQIVTTLRDMKFYRGLLGSALKLPVEPESADTKRLDWMLDHMRKQLWHTIFFEYQHCKTLREAIDAAIEDAKSEYNDK